IIYSSIVYPKEILKLNLPSIIATYTVNQIPPWPNIIVNNKKVSKMAADFFLNKGFKHFGYCGFDYFPWSQERSAYFNTEIRKAGHAAHIYKKPKSKIYNMWKYEQDSVKNWLKSLPKPVAVLASNDLRGQFILELCKTSGLNVPDEIAVLGIDNDKVVCSISSPPLTSININYQKAGFEAAQLLEKLMNGQKSQKQQIIIEPTTIITRRSTDTLAIDDKDIATALSFIRENANIPLQVDEVAQEVLISKRTLQRKFKKSIGHSIGYEIKKTRMEKIANILIETDRPVYRIANELGYNDCTNMVRSFRQFMELTPQAYRRKHK
ncbi:MAG: transcriptional regulator, partial [Archaeoglobales archaeon]